MDLILDQGKSAPEGYSQTGSATFGNKTLNVYEAPKSMFEEREQFLDKIRNKYGNPWEEERGLDARVGRIVEFNKDALFRHIFGRHFQNEQMLDDDARAYWSKALKQYYNQEKTKLQRLIDQRKQQVADEIKAYDAYKIGALARQKLMKEQALQKPIVVHYTKETDFGTETIPGIVQGGKATWYPGPEAKTSEISQSNWSLSNQLSPEDFRRQWANAKTDSEKAAIRNKFKQFLKKRGIQIRNSLSETGVNKPQNFGDQPKKSKTAAPKPQPLRLVGSLSKLREATPEDYESGSIYKQPPIESRIESIPEIIARFASQTQSTQSPELKRFGESEITAALRQRNIGASLKERNDIEYRLKKLYKDKLTDKQIANFILSGKLLGK